MLLTVAGTRSTRELAALVKALLDRCQVYAYADLAAVVEAVAAQQGIAVPGGQLDQVLYAMAAAQPATDGPAPTRNWVIQETTNNPVRLAEMLESAWMQLAAESSAELEAADLARAFETRYQRLTLPGWCCLLLHDTATGRPILPERVIGAVLAAGILSELLVAGRVDVEEGSLRLRAYTDADYRGSEMIAQIIARLPAGADATDFQRQARALPPRLGTLPDLSAAAASVLTEIRSAGRATRLHGWFRHLAPGAAELVRGELAKAEVIRPQQVKRVLRELTRYPPTDPMQVNLLRGSIIGPLASNGTLPQTAPTALLMELVRACGLARARADDWFTVNAVARRVGLAVVPHRNALARLLDLVEEAADAAVFSPT
jgi:hypothetical protein